MPRRRERNARLLGFGIAACRSSARDLRPRQALDRAARRSSPRGRRTAARSTRSGSLSTSIALDRRRSGAQTSGEASVAVMVVREHGELLLADEPGRHAVTTALGHIVERTAMQVLRNSVDVVAGLAAHRRIDVSHLVPPGRADRRRSNGGTTPAMNRHGLSSWFVAGCGGERAADDGARERARTRRRTPASTRGRAARSAPPATDPGYAFRLGVPGSGWHVDAVADDAAAARRQLPEDGREARREDARRSARRAARRRRVARRLHRVVRVARRPDRHEPPLRAGRARSSTRRRSTTYVENGFLAKTQRRREVRGPGAARDGRRRRISDVTNEMRDGLDADQGPDRAQGRVARSARRS